MYIITFYSFKGGVGRTLALANVAVDLAQQGRRVLLVDFDLEAPGLDTFDLFSPSRMSPGLVEFVSQYLETNKAPDVGDFIYKVPHIGGEHSGLWIMPSGRNEKGYAHALSRIDWDELYATRHGYLMFEDLKAQWEKQLAPDYVLIDSRTGHTEVSGICTRQLPDAVVLLFFPNEQNLRGLKSVADDIRAEAKTGRTKRIVLHFVMSNVPDLDDEDQIIEKRLKQFQQALGYSELFQIHRYDSLALLNQVIFTRERPRSRLAREYNALTAKVVQENPQDRDGAASFLKELSRQYDTVRLRIPPQEIEDRLAKIKSMHRNDGEILYRLAMRKLQDGTPDEAEELFSEALRVGYSVPRVLLMRAECRELLSDSKGSASDVWEAVQHPDLSDHEVERALRLIRKVDGNNIGKLTVSPALTALAPEAQMWLASKLKWSPAGLAAEAQLLRRLLERGGGALHPMVSTELALCEIGLGQFASAMKISNPERSDPNHWMQVAFNHAMAVWGDTGKLPRALFSQIVARDKSATEPHLNANYPQCMAIAYWGAGEVDSAEQFLEMARQRIAERPEEFSCWRYLMVSPKEFLIDIKAISQLIKGRNVEPAFFKAARARPKTKTPRA